MGFPKVKLLSDPIITDDAKIKQLWTAIYEKADDDYHSYASYSAFRSANVVFRHKSRLLRILRLLGSEKKDAISFGTKDQATTDLTLDFQKVDSEAELLKELLKFNEALRKRTKSPLDTSLADAYSYLLFLSLFVDKNGPPALAKISREYIKEMNWKTLQLEKMVAKEMIEMEKPTPPQLSKQAQEQLLKVLDELG